MTKTNNDSNATTPITEMTYEQWKEGLSTDPNYQGKFFMPQHFEIWFEQEQTCKTLTKTREERKYDAISTSIDSHEYEFYSPTYSTLDKEIDSIQGYETLLDIGEGSSGRTNEFDPPDVDLSFATLVRG